MPERQKSKAARPRQREAAKKGPLKVDKQRLDERLDEALKETFPASDPIAVTPRRRSVR